MRQASRFFSILLWLACSACATLDKKELNNLQRAEFELLRLKPMIEPNGFRIDVIRQTDSHYYTEDLTTVEDVSYHPLGFDLGNGLFFDLNGNLSLRINHLLGVEGKEDFTIVKQQIPERNRGSEIYTMSGDSLTRSFANRDRVEDRYRQHGREDSLEFKSDYFRNYTVVRSDTAIVYRGRKKAWDVIHKVDDHTYSLNEQGSEHNYKIQGNLVKLGKRYELHLTNHNKTILVGRRWKSGSDTLYSIERSNDRILVYNKDKSGKKIVLDAQSLMVYLNQTPTSKFLVRK